MMKVLTHRKLDDGSYDLVIHLDESKMVQDEREVQVQTGSQKVLVKTGEGNKDGKPVMEERDVPVMGFKSEKVGDPYPDPEYVGVFRYGPVPVEVDEDGQPRLDSHGNPKPLLSDKEYQEMQLREAKLLCDAQLVELKAADKHGKGKKLGSEGSTL